MEWRGEKSKSLKIKLKNRERERERRDSPRLFLNLKMKVRTDSKSSVQSGGIHIYSSRQVNLFNCMTSENVLLVLKTRLYIWTLRFWTTDLSGKGLNELCQQKQGLSVFCFFFL